MARILSGKMVIESETVDFALAVNAAIDSVGPAAMAKTIQIDLHIGDSIQFIRGDADRLQQIVWNLLSNAIKFTPHNGRIEVRLQQSGSHAEISVRDTGPGIPRDFLPHIFERFRQADSSNKQHGGLGLGLAIVRHLVEAHGGTVSAESAGEGQGAVFIVRLPALLDA
jgi:signal transduction histidine kinase